MSFTVMRPFSRPRPSTTGSFSMRCSWRIAWASSSVVPTGAVTRSSDVITSRIGRERFDSNWRSRFVMIPTSRSAFSTIGTPLMWKRSIRSYASRSKASAVNVIGFRIIPLSDRFTRSTSPAWSSGARFLWMIPIPPSRAIWMAMADSVTVSMAADRSGMRSSMPRVRRDETSVSFGWTSEWPGTSNTSSKVSASLTMRAADEGGMGEDRAAPRKRQRRRLPTLRPALLPTSSLLAALLSTLGARAPACLRRVGFDELFARRGLVDRLERLSEVREDLPARRRYARQNAVGSRDELEGLADRARAHGATAQLVLQPLRELLQPRCRDSGCGSVLRLQELDVVEDLIDLLVGKALDLAQKALAKHVVHALR